MNFDNVIVKLYTGCVVKRECWMIGHYIQLNSNRKIINENGVDPDLRLVDVQSCTNDWLIVDF